MKSIGLFGDSFTGQTTTLAYQNHWAVILSSKLKCEVINYGIGGSSVYFSYKEFLKHSNKHFLNIFLITEPSRYIKHVEMEGDRKVYLPNIISMETQEKNEFINPRYEDLKGWFMASDREYHIDMLELMLKEIKNLDKNCIFIPSFSFDEVTLEKFPDIPSFSLFELQKYQAQIYGKNNVFDLVNYYHETELLSGHFVPEMNNWIAEVLYKKVTTGFWDLTIPKPTKFKYSLDEAYIKL